MLREKRIKLGLRRIDIAKRMGVSQNYVGYLERGLRFPKFTNLYNLAQAYELTDEELVEYIKSNAINNK